MTERRFTWEDQQRFARLSGDFNPIHVDPEASARLLFGYPVVHGVHGLLWALEQSAAARGPGENLRQIQAAFQFPIGVDEPVRLLREADRSGGERWKLLLDHSPMTAIRAAWEPGAPTPSPPLPTPPAQQAPCLRRPLAELMQDAGETPLYLDPELARALFPNVMARLGPGRLATILAATRLVGMISPGHDSLFFDLSLTFGDPPAAAPPIATYRTRRWDERFSLLTLQLQGLGVEGIVQALVRPPPPRQPSAWELKSRVHPGEFAGQRALVAGGSQGLGEATAKLLAMGGAEVRLTFRGGQAEAKAIVADIRHHGGQAEALHWDVLDEKADLADLLGSQWRPNAAYYFPTPRIQPGPPGLFRPFQFQRYSRFYLDGFERFVRQLRMFPLPCQRLFYPSSVVVEAPVPELAEYGAAKAAGEALCGSLEKAHSGLAIFRPRLGKVETAQNISFFPTATDSPARVMAPLLRRMHHQLIKS